ncbi:MAG: four helix bundle protein [Candidatus Uhrbacteria bacterium]|nr:four helix bundle protein [Candidatus Uhrbacteria bacterium]
MDKWLTGFAGEEFSLVHKLYEWYKLLHADVVKYPKTERYTLGELLKSYTLKLIEDMWEANALALPERLMLLEKSQRTLDLMKLMVRLVYDLRIYTQEGYIYRQKRLQEIGKMLGGWRKKTRIRLGLDP